MNNNDICDWLRSNQNPTPPASSLLEWESTSSDELSQMSNRPGSPSKRRRTDNGPDDSNTVISEMSDRTKFEYPATPSSRQRSPVRDFLNQLRLCNPPIHCTRPNNIRLPEMVLRLREMLEGNFGTKVIPIGIKENLTAVDPDGTRSIPVAAFDEDDAQTPAQLYSLWEEVEEIYNEAAECEEYGQDENAWCGVIQVILKRGVKSNPLLQLKSIQSQTIDPALLPETPHKIPLSRKADYAFGFTPRLPSTKATYDLLGNLSISQTTDAHTKRVALFSGIEAKQSNGGKQEALAQLGIWSFAGLERNRRLAAMTRGSEVFDVGKLKPVVGWTVIGHDWHTYIVFRGIFEGQDRVYVEGPIETISVSTRSYYGIFKALDLVGRVGRYAGEEYWPWLRDEVLAPLANG